MEIGFDYHNRIRVQSKWIFFIKAIYKQSARIRWQSLLVILFYISSIIFSSSLTQAVQAAPQTYVAPTQTSRTAGNLTIEPITAYNLIVDSNVLSPSSYGPSAATLGAKFCNNSTAAMTNVWAYSGNFNPATNTGSPGAYPVRPPAAIVENPGLAGATATDFGADNNGAVPANLFSLKHQAGSISPVADASRFIGTLQAGECRTQYWLVSYPRKALVGGSWVSVTGGIKPGDDLWLSYYFWASSNATGSTPSFVWRPLTMRNEISAMANKIWPNGDNKVPTEFRNLVAETVGWNTVTPNDTNTVYPGQVVTSEGIWYDFGNVGAGFDNNYDFAPDRNAWVQPIGDAGLYDPGCFRLVRTHGVVIVKLTDESNLMIPFVDRMYFENIPDNNNGAIGLVYYDYLALDGACTAGLTPYQEVASGYDNEKFNADFGSGTPPLKSVETNMLLDKTGDPTVNAGGVVAYTLTFTLPQADNGVTSYITVGDPSLGMPLVYEDTVPAGMTYVANSASPWVTGTNLPSSPLPATVLYSTDSGVSWSATDPGNHLSSGPNGLVKIQWWLSQPITQRPNGGGDVTGTVSFQATAPAGPTSAPTVTNTGCLKLGNGSCFIDDSYTTLITGPYSLNGSVFCDDGPKFSSSGACLNPTNGGTYANGVLDASGEQGMPAVRVELYYDANGNGIIDADESLVAFQETTGTGAYQFDNLSTGSFISRVIKSDPDIQSTYGLTTPETRKAAITNASISGLNFGFAPPLTVNKTLADPETINIGELFNYTLTLRNNLPGGSGTGNSCTYTLWASKVVSDSSANPPGGNGANAQFQNPTGAIGSPDGNQAYTNLSNSGNLIGIKGFNVDSASLPGTITNVKYLVKTSERLNLKSDASIAITTYYNGNGSGTTPAATYANFSASPSLSGASFAGSTGESYDLTADVTALKTWTPADFSLDNTGLQVSVGKGAGSNSGALNLDAAAFLVTTNQPCPNTPDTSLNPAPLTDSFPTAYMDFVSANPPASSVNEAAGTLTWNNLGPIPAGSYKQVTVTFRATAAGANQVNTAASTGGKFANGLDVNSDSAAAQVTISSTVANGQISGEIFDDNNINGWSFSSVCTAGSGAVCGLQAGDTPIQGVRVQLMACVKQDGTFETASTGSRTCSQQSAENSWQVWQTVYTNSAGSYAFTNLRLGFYRVVVDPSTLPGSTQTADPTVTTPALCTGANCDNQSYGDVALSAITALGNIIGATNITNVNFGYNAPNTNYNTGDEVFFDWNANGLRDAGDEIIPNVMMRLLDAGGTELAVASTNPALAHAYAFARVNGVYTVQVDTASLPAAIPLSQTADPDQAGTCTVCDGLSTFTLSGADNWTRDFGYQPLGVGSIGDTVYRDLNGDSVQSGVQEVGIPNVTVSLQADLNQDGAWVTVMTTATGSMGNYAFNNLPDAAYRVVIETADTDLPKDASGTAFRPTTITTYEVVLSSGLGTQIGPVDNPAVCPTSCALDADFGFAPLAAFGDTIYLDINGNGTQDYVEVGIPGVTVNLHTFTDSNLDGRYNPGEPLGPVYATTTTNAGGGYLFAALLPGFYVAEVDTTTGGLPGKPLTGDPDADGVACTTLPEPFDGFDDLCDDLNGMRLYPGTNYTGADFGYKPTGVLGDNLWLDSNGNGVQDAGETGISFVDIQLVGPGCTPCMVQTDSDGMYLFANLADGTYTVSVDTADPDFPAGLISVYDPDAAFDGSTLLVITDGEVDSLGGDSCTDCSFNADFGYQYSGHGQLSGTVCLDSLLADADQVNQTYAANAGDQIGICGLDATDPNGPGTGETPFNNVTVKLFQWEDANNDSLATPDELTNIATTITLPDGDFVFTSIPENVLYLVSMSKPRADLKLTTQTGDSPEVGNQPKETLVDLTLSGMAAYQTVFVGSAETVQNVDFAFTTIASYDFGDLPDTYSTTLQGSPDGPRHVVPTTPTLYLGDAVPDAEENGQPTTTASGDGADEDGVQISPEDTDWSDDSGAVRVTITGSGYLAGWIDFNQDGDFTEPDEWVIDEDDLTTESDRDISFLIPEGVDITPDTILYARFRLFPSRPAYPQYAYTGLASAGEVEDYRFTWGSQADVSITKTDGVTRYVPGGLLTYTVTIENAGPDMVMDAVVSDSIPDQVSQWTWTCTEEGDASDCTEAASSTADFTDTVNLPPGSSITYTVYAEIAANATGSLVNTATLSSGAAEDPAPENNTATDMDTPAPSADLQISKTDGSATYTPGGSLTYTIEVTNAGPSAIHGAAVVDNLPANLTGVSWNCDAVASTGGASCAVTGAQTGSINTTVNLPVNGIVTFTVHATALSSATGDLTNQATITLPASATDPAPGNNSATDTDTPDPQADLQLTKTDGSATYTPGQAITYTIVVSNAGPSDVSGAAVEDTLPAHLTGISWNCDAVAPTGGATCAAAGDQAGDIDTTVDIPNGGAVTFTVNAVVLADASGTLLNQASVTLPEDTEDPAPENNSDTDTDTPALVADLSITKSDGAATYTPGGSLTYTIVVTNSGPGAVHSAAVEDLFPASLTNVSWNCDEVAPTGGAACAASGNQAGDLSTTVDLPVAATVTFTIQAEVLSNATGSLVNTAAINPPAEITDPDPANNAATDTDTPAPAADLSITKTDGSTTYTPGVPLTYTIVVTNSGPSDVTSAAVRDTLPAALTGVQWDCSTVAPTGGAACAAVGPQTGSINTIVDLPVGGTVTFTVDAVPASSFAGDLVNTATIQPPTGTIDPNPGSETATDTDSTDPQADLRITKTDGLAYYTPGGAITYTIVVTNAGPSAVTGATVSDLQPAALSGAIWNCDAVAPTNGASCAAVGSQTGDINTAVNLPVNGTVSFTLSATVANGTTGDLSNTATVTPPSSTTDPTPGNNSASDTDLAPAILQADLEITKTDGVLTYTAGSPLLYTLVVRNHGPDAVTGASVEDIFPANLTNIHWDCDAVAPTNGAACAAAGSQTGSVSTTVDLPVNGTVTFSVSATVLSNASGDLVNTASINPPAGSLDPTPGNNTASDTDTPNPQADLRITKTDGAATYTPGSPLSYTIVVSNNGPSDVVGAAVADLVPVTLNSVSWTCALVAPTNGATCAAAGNQTGPISSTVDLPVNGTVTFTLSAVVDSTATGNLANTATIGVPVGTTDPTPANNTATDTDTPNLQADLTITKTDSAAVYIPGNSLTYTVTVANNGPSAVTGAVITDPIPAQISLWTWTCSPAGGASGCTGVTNSAANFTDTVDLPVGGSITYTVTATTRATASGNLANTAAVTPPAGTTDLTPGNNSATDTDIPTPQADLNITKTDGVSSYTAGGTLTYTMVVTNSGPGAVMSAAVVDTLPAGLTAASWDCNLTTPPAGGAACAAAGVQTGNINTSVDLPVGGTVTFTVHATVTSSRTDDLTNTAVVTPPVGTSDPNPGNNTAADTDTSAASADLRITKTDGVTSYIPGGSLTYTMVVSNSGLSDITGATVTDSFPANLTNVTWDCDGVAPTGGAACLAAGNQTGNINTTVNLPVGGTVTFTAHAAVRASASGLLSNTASITPPAGTTDPTTENNTATDTDTADPQADLQISKTDGSLTYTPGNPVTYTIVVTNNGPSDVAGAMVQDAFPASLSSVVWDCNSTVPPTGGATCAAAGTQTGYMNTSVDLPVGSAVTFTIQSTVLSNAQGDLVNTATVTPPVSVPDPMPGNNTATDTDTLDLIADLSITKTDGVASYIPGGTLTYTIVVSNSGPGAVSGARVVDSFPAALTTVSWDCDSVAPTGGGGCAVTGTQTGNINTTVDLPVGGSVTFTVNATVSSSMTGSLANTATLTPPVGTTDPTPGDLTATDTDTANPQADLRITKNDGVPTYTPGSTTTYMIVVTNQGPSDVTNALVTDDLPAQILNWQWTCTAGSNGSCTGTAGAVTSDFSDQLSLAAGESITYTVAAQLDPDASISLENSAVVTPPAGVTDPTPANNTSTDIDEPQPEADLSITKSDGLSTYTSGGDVTYTIVVTNQGPSSVRGATVTDVLPADLIDIQWDCDTTVPPAGSASCAAAGAQTGNINTTVDLPVGGSVTFTVHATVLSSATGDLSNTATIDAPVDATDPSPEDNTSTDTDIQAGSADLSITKTDGVAAYTPGGMLTYTIVVANSGPSDAAGAGVTDIFPAGLTNVRWDCDSVSPTSGATCAAAGEQTGNIQTTVDLPVGGTVTFTVHATVESSAMGDLVNTAAITPPVAVTDPTPGDNTSTDTDSAAPETNLSLSKTVDQEQFSPGGALVYTLTVTNHGLSDARDVMVTDMLPAQVQYTSATPAPLDPNGAPLTWNLGVLAANETSTITLTVQVRDGVSDSFTNSGSVTTTIPETDIDDNISTVPSTPELPTPVELLYFRTKSMGSNQVRIQWAAAAEVDMFGYRLLRASMDDMTGAVEIAYVPSDPLNKTYEVVDDVPSQGQYWYCLVEVNTYGGESLLATASADLTGTYHRIFLPVVWR